LRHWSQERQVNTLRNSPYRPTNRFDIVEHTVLDLDKGHEYENKSEFTRGNIAVIATLKHVQTKFFLFVIFQ